MTLVTGPFARAAFLCLAFFGISAASAAGADEPVRIDAGGMARSYLLHLPSPLPAGPVPLVLAFHGGGGRGQGMARLSALDPLGFIVAYPDGYERHWNDGRRTIKHKVDDVGFVRAILDQVEARYAVDPARIFATGMSNGAIFTERLACELADRFAAVAPVAGTMPADIAPACRPARPVAVLQIAGTADPIMPYDGGKVADFGGRGEGGVVLPAAATAIAWAERNHCAGVAVPEALPPIAPPDGTTVTRTRWTSCAGDTAVTLLMILGGGHTWPGGAQYLPPLIIGRASRQLDASAAIVEFFLSQPHR